MVEATYMWIHCGKTLDQDTKTMYRIKYEKGWILQRSTELRHRGPNVWTGTAFPLSCIWD